MNEHNKNMVLAVAGVAAVAPYAYTNDSKYLASEEWVERFMLRKPDCVTIVIGSGKYSDDDRIAISKIEEEKTIVSLVADSGTILSDEFIDMQSLRVEKVTAFISAFEGSVIQDYVRKHGSVEASLAVAVPSTKKLIQLAPEFIKTHGAGPKNKAPISEILFYGQDAMSAEDVCAVRNSAEELYSLAVLSRIKIKYMNLPLCAVPNSVFKDVERTRHTSFPVREAKNNVKCSICVIKDICAFYITGRVEESNIEAISPITQVQNIPRVFRGDYAKFIKTRLVDSKRKISVFGPCNNRCVDCPDQVYSKPSIAPRDALRLVARAWAEGAEEVVLSEGEPTIRKDFIPLVKAIEWYGMKAVVETNGRLLMVDKFLELLKDRTSCELVARIAGHDSELHNKAVQTDSFALVVEGIKKAVSKGLRIKLSVRMRPDLVDVLHKLIEIAVDSGIDIVIDVPPHWIYFPDAITYSSLMAKISEKIANCESSAREHITIQGIPLCLMGLYQEMYRLTKSGEFAKPPVCHDCSLTDWCCGLPESYSLSFGTSELRPDVFNSESQICFPTRTALNDFDIEECPIKSGERESTIPEQSMMVKTGSEYILYEAADDGASPARVIETKSAKRNVWLKTDGEPKKLELNCHCEGCRKLHECAACFEEHDDHENLRGWSIDCKPRTLLVNRELENNFPLEIKYDEHITFRDFWQRMSRGGAGMPAYRTIIVHDSVDYFPSPERAVKDIAHLAPRGCDVIITGRNYEVVAGKDRGGDSVPVVRPHSISDAARNTSLILKNYIVNTGTAPSYWALLFNKEAAPAKKPHREKLASFFIIKTCVANCLMCNVQNYFQNVRMPLKKILEGLDELRVNGFELVDLFGGEVTLREDLEFILNYASTIGFKPMVITTGHSLEKKKVKSLRDAGAVRITVSLDGAEEITHEKIKNAKGLFQKAVEAAKSVASTPRIDLNINTVLLPENYIRTEDIVSLAGSVGASVTRFFLCVCSPATSTVERILSKEQLRELVDCYLPAAAGIAMNFGMEIDFRPELPEKGRENDWIKRISDGIYNPVYAEEGLCGAPDVRTLVDLDGAVYPCEAPLLFDSEHCIGNLNEEALIRILNSDKMTKFKKKSGKTDECAMCFGAMPRNDG